MNVLISLSQSFPVMRMHTATTQWAAMCVSARMATLEMAHSAEVHKIKISKQQSNPFSTGASGPTPIVVGVVVSVVVVILLTVAVAVTCILIYRMQVKNKLRYF